MQKATCFPLLFCITGIAQMLWLWPQHCFFKVTGHVDDGIYSWSPWEICFLACDACPCWRWYKTKSFNRDSLGVFILFGGREGNGDPTPQLFHRRTPILLWPIQSFEWDFGRYLCHSDLQQTLEERLGDCAARSCLTYMWTFPPLYCFLKSQVEKLPLLLATGVNCELWLSWFYRAGYKTQFILNKKPH